VATPREKRAATLADAVAQLKSDPGRSVRLHVDDVDLELHLVAREDAAKRLGDFMAGESPDGPARRSILGLCADLGPAPSAEAIDESRREIWAKFPRDHGK
jgi:hypothetical protein